MGFRWLESGSEFNFNQNRLCMVLMGVARHHNYLQLNGVKLNTIQFFSITGKTELAMKNRRIKALKPVLHLVFIKITIAFSVYKQILVFVLYENLNVYSGECVCVCFLSKDAWHESEYWSHRSIYIGLLTKICWRVRDARTEHTHRPRPTWRNLSHFQVIH